jgi:hypothetical protein
MRQRGRKSAELVAIGIDGKPPKLTPPADLQEAERAMFVELIDACDARHFRLSDLPLLTFKQHCWRAARLVIRTGLLIGKGQ